MGPLRNRLGRLALKTVRRLTARLIGLRQLLSHKFPLPPTLSLETVEGVLRVVDRGGNSVAISHPDRARLFRVGIPRRLESLAEQYCLPANLFEKPLVFVDVGANVGEFGILVEKSGGTYIAIEPDPAALRALRQNVTSSMVYPIAVSDAPSTQKFFLKPETADSSLFPPDDFAGDSLEIAVDTLDALAEREGFPAAIDVLKVEAEGMEPEVLRGAEKMLSRTRLCAVDAGPERGGKSTAPEVTNYLLERGFRLIDVHLERGTFLFERVSA